MSYTKKWIFALAIAFVIAPPAFAESLYVQSLKASLKSEPQMNAQDVTSLQRGDELTVIETKGIWFQVEKGGAKGWISKLFVNKTKPIGAASLAQEVPVSEAKTSRRRENSYAVSASTRGLMPVQRTREGRESYRSDNVALEAVERLTVDTGELNRFQADGKLLGQ